MSFATADERYFVDIVNNTREEMGLDSLRIAKSLNEAADDHTEWMLDTSKFSHTGEDGSSASERIREAGFPMNVESWSTRENLGYISVRGGDDLRDEIRQMHKNLMDSPSHRKNILDPDLEYIGIGLEVGQYSGHTVLMATQNYGRTTDQPEIDNGRFPVSLEPSADLSIQSRTDWLQDRFDGRIKRSSDDDSKIMGTDRSDDFRLTNWHDVALGKGGYDWMNGGAGDDTLEGGQGFDRLIGGTGYDVLRGGHGNDTLEGQRGSDLLRAYDGNDLLFGGHGHDTLSGEDGRDTLVGGNGNDQMSGGAGSDYLLGGTGYDMLRGSAGSDTLEGGRGNDLLIGGSSADTFIFKEGHDRDTISDYQAGFDRLMIDDDLLERSVTKFYDDIIRETASGVVLDFGDGDQVTIKGRGLTAEAVADNILLF